MHKIPLTAPFNYLSCLIYVILHCFPPCDLIREGVEFAMLEFGRSQRPIILLILRVLLTVLSGSDHGQVGVGVTVLSAKVVVRDGKGADRGHGRV